MMHTGDVDMEFLREHSFIIAQIIGFCAMATAITSFQLKKRQHILIFQLICTALWTLHFLVLGNMTGCVINGMQTFRCVVFYYKDTQKWAQSKIWLAVFYVASIVAGVLTWENIWSLFPILGMIFSTLSQWMQKPKHIRLLTLPVAGVWFIYNMSCRSYAGMCNEVLASISVISALIRLDYKKK